MAAGRTQEAVEHLRKAIATRPTSRGTRKPGILLLMSGHAQEAVEHLETALKGEKNLANYMNLAWAYAQMNRLDKAIPLVEKALELAREEGNAPLCVRSKQLCGPIASSAPCNSRSYVRISSSWYVS